MVQIKKIDATDTLNSGRQKINTAIDALVNSEGNTVNVGFNESFDTLADLKAKYPSGASGMFFVFDNGNSDGGHSYMWVDSAWKDLGIYQGKEIAADTVTDVGIIDTKPVSKNILNPYTMIRGAYINGTTGALVIGTSASGLNVASPFIDVMPGESYAIYMTTHNCVGYDINLNIKQSFSISEVKRVIVIPEGVYKIRISYKQSDESIAMLSKGKSYFQYEPYLFTQTRIRSKEYDNLANVSFDFGSIDGTTGANLTSNTRIRTDLLYFDKGDEIGLSEKSGEVIIGIYNYNDEGAFTSFPVGLGESRISFTIKISGFYRIVLAYVDTRLIQKISDISKLLIISKKSNQQYLSQRDFFTSGANKISEWSYGSIHVDNPYGTVFSKTRISSKRNLLVKNQVIYLNDPSISKYQLMQYDLNGTYIGSPVLISSGDTGSYTIKEVGYYTIVLAYNNDATILDIQTLANNLRISKVSDEAAQFNNSQVISDSLGQFKKIVELPNLGGNFSSHCFVGEEFWCFTASDYSESGTLGKVHRYKFDTDFNPEHLGSFNHNWNHVNCVGYSETNDTLICSSFVGDTTPVAEKKYEIYLLGNASSFKDKTEVLLTNHAIKVTVPAEWGNRMGATFSSGNLGKDNIGYYITNDNRSIRKLIFGRGTHNLGSGSYVSGKSENELNGSYKLLDEFFDKDSSLEVNQGACFYGDKLYLGLGHEGVFYQVTKLKDGSIYKKGIKDTFFNDDGTELYSTKGFSGITVTDKHILCGLQENLLIVYKK